MASDAGEQRRPTEVERIAAEVIAADEERARDWLPAKASPAAHGLPAAMAGDRAFDDGLLSRLPSFLTCAVLAVIALIIVLVGVVVVPNFLLEPPGLAVASPTPTAPPTAPAAESPPAETSSPTENPAEPVSTETPDPLPPPRAPDGPPPPPVPVSGGTFDDTPRRDLPRVPTVVTDSGVPIDDGVTGITRTVITLASDRTSVVVTHQGPMVNGDTDGLSRASQLVLGRRLPAATHNDRPVALAGAPGSILGAPEPEMRFEPLAIFFWQLHDDEVTMGELDPATGAQVPSEVVVSHHEPSGTFSYSIPPAHLPIGADAAAVASFHSPRTGEERRSDVAGPFHLHAEWRGSEWLLDDTPYAQPRRPGSFIGVSSQVVLVDEQGNELGSAPAGHPAEIGQTDFQVVGDHLVFCAALPNMTLDVERWVTEFTLGDGITGFWRRDGAELRMRAQGVDGNDVADAVFLGQSSGERVCIGILREDALGIGRFGVATIAHPAAGGQPARHRLERDIDPPL